MTPPEVPVSPPQRRSWRRISLFRLFAVITFVIVLWSHVRTTYQLHHAQQENLTLRRQLGLPPTEEDDRLTAGVMTLPGPNEWRFHVHKPAGRKLVLKHAFKRVGGEQLPTVGQGMEIGWPAADVAGQFEIDVSVRERRGRPTLFLSVGFEGGKYTRNFTPPPQHFFDRQLHGEARDSFTRTCESQASEDGGLAGRPFVLLRHVEFAKNAQTYDAASEATAEGLLVWLEDAPAGG